MNDKKSRRSLRSGEYPRIKQVLKEAFDAPAPLRKEAFLQDCPLQPVSIFHLMRMQIGFIRKRIWVLSGCLFALALYKAHRVDPNLLWELSALTPFIAMTLLSENARSRAYKMAELEMSCRFSRKSILLARMGILALSHLLLLCLLSPLAYLYSGFSLLQTGIYLLVPYLLTVVLGLHVTRKVPGRESLAACACIAAAVSGLCAFLKFSFSMLWSPAFRDEWFMALLLLLFLSALEVRKTVRQLEGNKWNFS